jgi:hypothetical protein
MKKFFFVFLHESAPMPPGSEYFERYTVPGADRYTVATEVQPSVAPGMLRIEPVQMDGDVGDAIHVPLSHVRGMLEISGETPPTGFSVGAKS